MFQLTTHAPSSCSRIGSAALLLLLAGCGGGGSSKSGVPLMAFEDETVANDTVATANLVRLGAPIHGDLTTAGDVDTFALALAGGKVVKLELFATRHDQAGWGAGPTVPRLTLLDTDANENGKLLEHDYSGQFSTGWYWGRHDLDIPMYLVPATGTYYVRVAQDNGELAGSSYILRASYVSVPGLQHEAEPAGTSGVNDTFGTAQSLHAGTMHGFHVPDEVDYYVFGVSAPTIVRFELTAYRNGAFGGAAAYYDPVLRLYGPDGTTFLYSDDDTYFYDSAIDFRIDEPGSYYIVVDEYGGGGAEYFLGYKPTLVGAAAESEPNENVEQANPIAYGQRRSGQVGVGEEDWYAFSGTAGDMIYLQVFDQLNSSGSGFVATYLYDTDGLTQLGLGGFAQLRTGSTILQRSGTFYVRVADPEGLADYTIDLTRVRAAVYETEPNDLLADAAPLGLRVAGVIDPFEDVDIFRVELRKDQLVRFVCYASNAEMDSNGDFEHSGFGSQLVPRLALLDSEGLAIAVSTCDPDLDVSTESVTQPLPSCSLVFTAETSGTYYIRPLDWDGGSGPAFYYVLEFERR